MTNYRQIGLGDVIQAIFRVLLAGGMLTPLAGQAEPRWQDVTAEMGIVSPDRLPPSGRYPLTESFHGRAVPFDFDLDGDLDLFLTYGPHAADSLYAGLNRLYRQDDTAWVDVTAETGLARFPPAGNAAVGDVNGDGYLDLYLCMFGSDRLLLNEKGLRWNDVTDSAGVANDYWASEAVFFDANRDGYLDLYVANYVNYPRDENLVCIDHGTGQRTWCDPRMYDPAPNRLFLGDSLGRFQEATDSLGLADTTSRSLAVKLLDADGDGRLDLLVLSHYSPNLLYLAKSDTGFVERGLFAGVALGPDGSDPEWNQVQVMDANGDSSPDLLFTRHDGELLLLLNDGRGRFWEGHYQTGLFQPRFPYRATTAAAVDLDFNGTMDLLLADTEFEHIREAPQSAPPQAGADTAALDTTVVDSLGAVMEEPVRSDNVWPTIEVPGQLALLRRVLLSDDQHRFRAVEMEVPLLLDTTLLVPWAAAAAIEDTAMTFMEDDLLEMPLFPLPDEESVEPAPEENADFSLVDATAAGAPEYPEYVELDTLRVRQEAERYLVVDLDGDGVKEIVASYPVGLFRIWKRVSVRGVRYVGLWPRTVRPGTTAIGAELRVMGNGPERRIMVTDNNPILLYLSRWSWSVDVVVRWPDGLENQYRTSMLNRTYTLMRPETGP